MNSRTTKIYDTVVALFGIHDSHLQAYRNVFLTSQSVIFAVSVFIASGSAPYLAFLLLPLGIYMIVWLWIPITDEIGYDAWFLQLQLLCLEEGKVVTVKPTEEGYNIQTEQVYAMDPRDIDVYTNFRNWQRLDIKTKKEFFKNDPHGKDLVTSKARGTRRKMQRHLPVFFVVLWIVLIVVIIIRWANA